MRSVELALLASLVACRFAPHESGAVVGDGGDDGGAIIDAAGSSSDGGAGFAIPTCGTPGSFQDAFPGTMLAPQWNEASSGVGTAVVVGSNQLTLTPPNGGPDGFVAVYSKHFVNLVGGAIEVEAPSVFPATSNGVAVLDARLDDRHYAAISVAKNVVSTSVVNGVMISNSVGVPYDGSEPYWRIRESAGTLRFELSADGTTWSALSSVPTPSFVQTVDIVLGADAGSGSTTFAQLDTALPATPWCKVDTLHDAFSAGDTQWLNYQPQAAPMGPTEQRAPLPPPPPPPPCTFVLANAGTVTSQGAPTVCYFGSTYAWDLTDSSAIVEFDTAVPGPTWTPFVAVAGDSALVEIFVEPNMYCVTVGGALTCSIYTFDASGQDKYWRVSETTADHMITFASSPDKTTWTTIVSEPEPFAPTGVELRLGATNTTDLTLAPAAVTFGGVN